MTGWYENGVVTYLCSACQDTGFMRAPDGQRGNVTYSRVEPCIYCDAGNRIRNGWWEKASHRYHGGKMKPVPPPDEPLDWQQAAAGNEP